jgi:nitroimidazol reductase NimA-like FMN-containing flavoprotein (pyridoxamine 5'-phosphate oxidase superfamily)
MAASRSPRLSVEEAWAYLTDGHTGILTTLRRDGVPIAMPLWYAVLDRRIYVQTRGRKLQRIRHDPRASFLVETGEHWADLAAVHLTGTCEVVDIDDDLSARFRAEIDRKYAAFRSPSSMPADTAAYYARALTGVVRFTPDERMLNWANRKLVDG